MRICSRCSHKMQDECGFCLEGLCGCWVLQGTLLNPGGRRYPLIFGRTFCGEQCLDAFDVRRAITPSTRRNCAYCDAEFEDLNLTGDRHCSGWCARNHQDELEMAARHHRKRPKG